MALPVFRNAGAKAAGTGAVTPALPASMVAGDICILVATTIAGGSLSITANGSISTWTEITSGGLDVASGEKLYVWWGRFSSGSTGPTVTPGSDHCCAGIAAWSGCVPNGSPIDVSATGTEVTSDTSFSFATGLTTGENDCMCIGICSTGADSNVAQIGAMANTSLGSLNNRMDYCTNSNGGGGFGLTEGTKATAGTMGTFTATIGGASPKAYIAFSLRPAVAVTVAAGVGGPLVAGFAPVLNISQIIGLGQVTVSGFVPVIGKGLNIGLCSVTATGLAPTIAVSNNISVACGLGAPVITGLVPTISVSANQLITAGLGAVTASGFAPSVSVSVNQIVATGVGNVPVTGFAPTVSVSDNKVAAIGVGSPVVTGFVPLIDLKITAGIGSVTASGFTPAVAISDNQIISTDTGSGIASGFMPSLVFGINLQTGDITVSGFAPEISISDHKIFSPGSGAAIATGLVPTVIVSDNIVITPAAGQLVTDGHSPVIDNGINADVGQLVIIGHAPTVSVSTGNDRIVVTETGELVFIGYVPKVSTATVSLNSEIKERKVFDGRISLRVSQNSSIEELVTKASLI